VKIFKTSWFSPLWTVGRGRFPEVINIIITQGREIKAQIAGV
jgi:hypothetical protein